jgi:hypothetical protein
MIENPPSTGIAVPVTKSDALDARNTAMPAKSADAPHRAAGVRAIREVRVGIDGAVPDKVLKMPPCDPSVIAPRLAALFKTRALDAVRVGGIDLSGRQRVGDQEFPAMKGRDSMRRCLRDIAVWR